MKAAIRPEKPKQAVKVAKRTAKKQRQKHCDLIKGLSEAEKLQICLDCPYAECVEGGD